MKTKRNITILIITLSLVLSACGSGQLFGPTLTPTPTLTPLPTSTPTPIPNPLSQIDLSKIVLQSNDLASDFQQQGSNTSTEEQDVINFYAVSFRNSNNISLTNIIRVYENESLASNYFQEGIKEARSDSAQNGSEIPGLGDESFAGRSVISDGFGIAMVTIAWRYKETFVYFSYESTSDLATQSMMDGVIVLAQQIDARLKKSLP